MGGNGLVGNEFLCLTVFGRRVLISEPERGRDGQEHYRFDMFTNCFIVISIYYIQRL